MADRFFVGDTDSDWNDAANWATASGGAGGAGVPTGADDAIFDANSPNCNLDVNAVCLQLDLQAGFAAIFDLVTFDIDIGTSGWLMAAGQIDLGSGTLSVSGVVTVSGGTINKDTSTVLLDPSTGRTWDFNGATLNDLSVDIGTGGATGNFTGTVIVDGTFDLTDWGVNNKFVGTVTARGDVIAGTEVPATDATGKILINGGGDQDIYRDKAGGTGHLPGIEINSTGGTVTFFDTLKSYGSGGWVYTAGTVAMGTSRIDISGSGTYVLDSAGMSFYNLANLKTGGSVLSVTGNNVVSNDLTLDGVGLRMLTGTIQVAGDTIVTPGTTQSSTSTTVVEINGGGAQELYSDKAGGTGIMPGLKINKASGTLTIYDIIGIDGGGSLEWVAGTVDAITNTSKILIASGGSAKTVTGGPVEWYDWEWDHSGTTDIIVGTLIITGTFTLTDVTTLNGGTIEARGDISATDANVLGTTLLTIAGGADQDIGINDWNTDVTVNKSGGTAQLTEDLALLQTAQKFTLEAGTFALNSFLLTVAGEFTQTGGTFEGGATDGTLLCRTTFTVTGGTFNAPDRVIWRNVISGTFVVDAGGVSIDGDTGLEILGRTNSIVDLSAGTVTAKDVEFSTNTGANHRLTNGTLQVTGDVSITGAGWDDGSLWTATLKFTGTAAQTVNDTIGSMELGDIDVDKAALGLTLASAISLESATVTAGTFDTGGFDLTVPGALDIDGMFRLKGDETLTLGSLDIDATTSTIEFYDSVVVADLTPFATKTLFNLLFGNDKEHQFATGIGNEIRVDGALQANGSLATPSVLRSKSDGVQWFLNLQGTSALTNKVDVKDSNADTGVQVVAIGSADSLNNDNWEFTMDEGFGAFDAFTLGKNGITPNRLG